MAVTKLTNDSVRILKRECELRLRQCAPTAVIHFAILFSNILLPAAPLDW